MHKYDVSAVVGKSKNQGSLGLHRKFIPNSYYNLSKLKLSHKIILANSIQHAWNMLKDFSKLDLLWNYKHTE